MSIIDDMKVVITSDTTGVDVGFKKLLNVAQQSIKKISATAIDWNTILTGNFSPAIMGIVGGTLGTAIATAIGAIGAVVAPTTAFQSSLNQTATAAGLTATQLAGTGDAAIAMSEQVTPSAEELAAAMVKVSGIFGVNTQSTKDIVQAMAQLHDSGFGPLNDIVSSSMDLFRQFGVTTEAGAIQMLTDLMHGAEMAKEPLPELASQFSAFANQLTPAQKSLQSFNGDISAYAAAVQTLGASGAASIMDVIGSSAATLGGPVEQFGISLGTVQQALTKGDLAGLVSKVADSIAKFPSTAAIHLIGAEDYSAFSKLSQNYMPAFLSDAATAATNAQSIAEAFDQSDSFLRQLQLDWNTLKASLIIGPSATPGASQALLNTVTAGDNSPNWTGMKPTPNWTTRGQSIAQRLNNPGDLKYAGQSGATADPSGFAKFATFADGFQALENQLSRLIADHPNATLEDIIKGGGSAGSYGGYAPVSDSNSPNYASDVAAMMGVNVKTPIEQLSVQLQNFATAIAKREDANNPNLPAINTNKTVNFTNFFTVNGSAPTASTVAMTLAQQLYNNFQGI